MRGFIASLALALGLVLPVSAAQADDFSIAPRTWLLFDSLSGGDFKTDSGSETFSFNSPPFQVLMAGASLTYRSDSFLPNTTFTATGLFGSDKKTLTTRGSSVQTLAPGKQQIIVTLQTAPQRLRRRDFELTAQTRMNDLLSFLVGVRYERARVRFHPHLDFTTNNPFTGEVVNTSQDVTPFTGGYDFYSARGGLALAAPMSDDGSNLVYGNLLGFIGVRREKNDQASPVFDNATLAGPDLSIGYAHRFGDHLTLDVRYRALFFFSVSGGGRFSEPKSTHGPNAALTFRF